MYCTAKRKQTGLRVYFIIGKMGVVYAKEHFNEGLSSNDSFSGRKPFRNYNMEDIQARVDKVSIDGLGRTKDDIIVQSVQDLMKARNLQEVILKAHRTREKLSSLGCFKNIGIFIDTSSGEGSSPHGYEVTFSVQEMRRIVGGVNIITSVGSNECPVQFSLKFPNMLGRGETAAVDYTYGLEKTGNFSVSFQKPFFGALSPTFTASLFRNNEQWQPSGYGLLGYGSLLDFSFFSAAHVRHNLQWEGAFRNLSCLSRNVAFAVREQSGPSLKSSVRHILTVDHRNAPVFPTRGSAFQLNSEYAGLGGNIGFFRNEAFFEMNTQLLEDVVVQTCIQAGYLNRFSDKTVSICDKFFLGGPSSVRGFRLRGVGPHVDKNAVGADAYWAVGLHLFMPLPFRPWAFGLGERCRTHLFLTAGNIGQFNFTDDLSHNANEVTKDARMSCGVGLAVRVLSAVRLELNYCVPLSAREGDALSPGVQFGIGINML
ncbi:sorting and assembly machinery component 50 homolog [Bacillus rossius redtenbacheri]|uniref:sorting and assembly machinery component 50 homolog n=1 Tax=Bacillus rossius redtenbacheri TaxID=93214 RepID=UPI002FDE2903